MVVLLSVDLFNNDVDFKAVKLDRGSIWAYMTPQFMFIKHFFEDSEGCKFSKTLVQFDLDRIKTSLGDFFCIFKCPIASEDRFVNGKQIYARVNDVDRYLGAFLLMNLVRVGSGCSTKSTVTSIRLQYRLKRHTLKQKQKKPKVIKKIELRQIIPNFTLL